MTQITALAAHPRNYNRHSAGQVADLARSLTRFGQRKPVVTFRNRVPQPHMLDFDDPARLPAMLAQAFAPTRPRPAQPTRPARPRCASTARDGGLICS